MATIESKLKQMLEDRGMFTDQAQAVFDMAKARTDLFPDMERRWADRVEGYPTSVLAVLWLGLQWVAVEWIDANLPKAWYRPVFTGEPIPTD